MELRGGGRGERGGVNLNCCIAGGSSSYRKIGGAVTRSNKNQN